MLKFSLENAKRLLFLGAHSDDIEIGCGGTVLELAREFTNLEVRWVVFASDPSRAAEAAACAALFLKDVSRTSVMIKDFRDGYFPYLGGAIKDCFEELKREISPDLILTHNREDLHQDHRLVSELTWNTFRDHLIWEYEVPKYDGDFGSPHLFVHLSESVCRRKLDYVLSSYETQRDKRWFSEDTFLSIMRLRGVESNAPGRYAEAFYCRKLVLSPHCKSNPETKEPRP